MVIIMFTNYKIINNTLYLYVDYSCEIGSLFDDKKNSSLVRKIKQYIKDKKINFNGTKAILLLSSLMLGTVYLTPNVSSTSVQDDKKYVYNIVDKSIPNIEKGSVEEVVSESLETINEEKNITFKNNFDNKKNVTTSSNKDLSIGSVVNNETYNETKINSDQIITLRRTNGQVVNISLEDYIVGVVAAEMPASFNSEALKAQSVVARTYTLKLLESGRTITDDVSTQVYKSNDELQSIWGSSYNTYYNKIKNAVSSTKGLCIKYNGSLIDAVYHSTSNGYTEDSVNVWGNNIPYLKIVTSPWDTSASSFLRSETISFEKISSVLGIDFNRSSLIEIISKDDSNRISKIKFNDKEYTGVEIRNMLALRSADFDFNITDNGVVFTTRGYGHGVGMSQYGANGMANAGYSFEQILKYYYTGVEVVNN